MAADGFLEHATFGGNRYGTSVAAVESIAQQNRICVLDIEMEVCSTDSLGTHLMSLLCMLLLTLLSQISRHKGVKQIKSSSRLHPRFLFLSPPSLEALEARLRGRGTDSEDAIQRRLAQARVELEYAQTPGVHDKVVVNDDLDTAYQHVKDFALDEQVGAAA